jgi:acetoin utilization protein AcuB
MKVEDIMSRHLVTVDMDDTLRAIRRLFQTRRFHHLMVVEEGRLRGVISDRDYLRLVTPGIEQDLGSATEMAVLNRRAHQIMSRKPVTIGPGASVEEAIDRFLDDKVSCLPVVDAAGGLRGVLSWKDVLRIVHVLLARRSD